MNEAQFIQNALIYNLKEGIAIIFFAANARFSMKHPSILEMTLFLYTIPKIEARRCSLHPKKYCFSASLVLG